MDPSEEWNGTHVLFPTPVEVGRGPDGQLALFPGMRARRFDPQFPMTPEGQLQRMFKQEFIDNEREKRINQQIERLAEEAKHLAEVADRLEQLRLDGVPLDVSKIEPKRSRMRPQWDTYGGFHEDLLDQEQAFTGDVFTKAQAAGQIGCVVRSITRRMGDFGLPLKCWPPSTWPEQQPPPPRRRTRHTRDS